MNKDKMKCFWCGGELIPCNKEDEIVRYHCADCLIMQESVKGDLLESLKGDR